MAHNRECLSTARYGSRHSENGRAMPYLKIHYPHVPNRADSATLSRASSREERSEGQNYFQRPLAKADSPTSGTKAQTEISIRFSHNRRPVGAGTEGGGMAHVRECLSTARYGSRHSENGRAMPYLQIKCPHVPNRADSATYSRPSSLEYRSERQTYFL